MFTIACCLGLELGLGLDLVSVWLVVTHMCILLSVVIVTHFIVSMFHWFHFPLAFIFM